MPNKMDESFCGEVFILLMSVLVQCEQQIVLSVVLVSTQGTMGYWV
jgi:hypothetical protein